VRGARARKDLDMQLPRLYGPGEGGLPFDAAAWAVEICPRAGLGWGLSRTAEAQWPTVEARVYACVCVRVYVCSCVMAGTAPHPSGRSAAGGSGAGGAEADADADGEAVGGRQWRRTPAFRGHVRNLSRVSVSHCTYCGRVQKCRKSQNK
jgi:hypothetical protein